MTDVISRLVVPAYNLFKGKDYYSGCRIDELEARKNARRVLTEIVKVSSAIAGFFAISALMNRMPSPLYAYGAGSAILGGVLLISPKISVILYDASLLTAGLLLVQKGFVDLLAIPIVHSVKTAIQSISQARVKSFLQDWTWESTGSSVLSGMQKTGMGYARSVGAIVTVRAAYSLMNTNAETVSKSQKLVDKVIFYCIRKVAFWIGPCFVRPLKVAEENKKP